ncbi:MAG: oligosaccharide flippase family protein [Bacteroidetes bacterium]|nr:oligosaccharide flippase family protein [Bacteroidota bacterium]
MKINIFKLFRENKYPVFSNITERLFFFLIFLIIAREYPTESYGQLITIFSLANIFVIIFDLGIPLFLQKEFSSGKKYNGKYSSGAVAVYLALFPVYFILLFLYRDLFFREFPLYLFTAVSVLVYLFSISNLLNKILSGLRDFHSQFRHLLYSRSAAMILFLIFSLILKTELTVLIFIITAGALIQIAGLLNSLVRSGIEVNPLSADLKTSFQILRLSVPLGLAVLFNFIYDKIDIILISKLTDFDSVAFYSVAYGIYKSSSLIYSFLFVTGLSRISYLSGNKKAVKLFYKKYLNILLPVCLLITAALFFFPGFIIRLFYTDKFAESIFILKILSLSVTGLALNNLTGVVLNGIGMFRQNMNVTFFGLLINIILNIFFIPVFGIAGAAAVTLITEYFIFTGDYIYLKKFNII